jgi:hypothetical protein
MPGPIRPPRPVLLARRCQTLTDELEALTSDLDTLTRRAAPLLLARRAVGIETAGTPRPAATSYADHPGSSSLGAWRELPTPSHPDIGCSSRCHTAGQPLASSHHEDFGADPDRGRQDHQEGDRIGWPSSQP